MTPPRALGTLLIAVAVAACGSAKAALTGHPRSTTASASSALASAAASGAPASAAGAATTTTHTTTATHVRVSLTPVSHYPGALTARWQVMTTVAGVPAMWIAERNGVTLVRMDQHHAHLALHAGTGDPGGTGWRFGPAVAGHEIHRLIMGMNGGFRFSTGSGGFESFGRVALPLRTGLASVVTYRSGRTDIGAWGQGVPAARTPIASVRQNLTLLIDHGVPASSATSCGASCWGATIGGLSAVARSGLGIRADGQLIWAAGEGLTVAQLADAMVGAGVQRAIELDINPDWVAGYVFIHHRRSPLTPVPIVPGQYGIYGHLLTPYARDFFTVLSA